MRLARGGGLAARAESQAGRAPLAQPAPLAPTALAAVGSTGQGPTLVALDIDGTVAHADGSISPAVRSAIGGARAAGHEVVISTGRCVLGALPVIAELQIERGWAVCSNGAVTVRLDPRCPGGFEPVDVRTFDAGPAISAVHHGIPGALMAVEVLGRGFLVNEEFGPGEIAGQAWVVPWWELAARPAHRLSVRGRETDRDSFAAAIAALGLPGVSYTIGYSAWIDVTGPGVSKASALEELRRSLGIDPQLTMAVGDSDNDVEMLRWAARGIAMAHSPASVLAAADEVTSSVWEDGVAHALRPLLDSVAP